MKIRFALILFLVSVIGAAQEPQTRPDSVYHHPAGFEFRYPPDWTIRESPIGEAELVPPDRQMNENGATEGFMLWGIGGNFTGPVDAGLAGYLNALVTRTAPFLKQDGDPQRLDSAAGPAMTMTWSGASDDGAQVTARTYSVIHRSFAFVLVMLGSRERMIFREAAVSEMFQSFRMADGVRDPALTGNWQSPPSAGQTQPAGDSGIHMELRADGSFEFLEAGGDAGEEGRMSGNWYASDGRLCFVYPESFFLNFRYELAGSPGSRKLILRHSSGAVQTLVETPAAKK